MVDRSLAGGVSLEGTFNPDQLYAGEADIVTTQGSVPAAQGALTQYAVVSQDAAGNIIAFDGTNAYGVLPHAIPDAGVAQDTPVIIGGVLNFDVLTGHALTYGALKEAFAKSNSNIVIQKLY
jgi:hypothetical protein